MSEELRELKAYLEEREARMEAGMDERLARFEARMDDRFVQSEARTEARMDDQFARSEARMGERLVQSEARMEARMDDRFARSEARFDDRFARLEARFDDRFDKVVTENRHTRILVEGVHDNVRLLAEAIIGTGERIEALREETLGRFDEIKASVDMIHQAWVPRVQRLETRIKNMEDKAERENRDVLDVVRERFGKSQA